MAPGGGKTKKTWKAVDAQPSTTTTTTTAVPTPKLIKSKTQPHKWDEDSKVGRWEYLQRLGSGAYGETWRARDYHTGEIVCIKVQVSKAAAKGEGDKKSYWQDTCAAFQMHEECNASKELLHNPNHPNYDAVRASLVVKYLEDHTKFKDFTYAQGAAWMQPGSICTAKETDSLTEDDDGQYVVMEYLEDYHTVRELLKREKLPRYMMRTIAQKVALVIDYLQSFDPPMIHRDLRVHNIMVKGYDNVKVIDLGLLIRCRPFYDINPHPSIKTHITMKQYWVPHEVCKAWDSKTYGVVNYSQPHHSFDIYSLGVLCVEMLSDPTNFFQRSSKTRVAVSDVVGEGWESLGLRDRKILIDMVGDDPAKRPYPAQVFFALSSGCNMAPTGTMCGPFLRYGPTVKFLNQVHRLCSLQLYRTKGLAMTGEERQKIAAAQNTLANTLISLINEEGGKDLERGSTDVLLKHLVDMCEPDSVYVTVETAENNTIEVLRFIDYMLTDHLGPDRINYRDLIMRKFSMHMMNSSGKRHKYSYIHAIWMANAPGPDDLLAKWMEKKWFPEIHKFQDLDVREYKKKRVPEWKGKPEYKWSRTYPNEFLSMWVSEPEPLSEGSCQHCKTPRIATKRCHSDVKRESGPFSLIHTSEKQIQKHTWPDARWDPQRTRAKYIFR